MGHSKKIRLIVRTEIGKRYLAAWQVRPQYGHPGHGAPNAENLAKWRDAFNLSCMPGGPNEHLGAAGWIQCRIEIFNQETGEVVARFNPPMFEVMPGGFRNWTGEKKYPAYKPY